MGGGGSASARTAGIAHKGVRNLLRHVGILSDAPEVSETTYLDTTADECVHVAQGAGLIEFLVDLGENVATGDTIARIWPTDRTGSAPHEIAAQTAGILATRHFPGLIRMGDCLAVIGQVRDHL